MNIQECHPRFAMLGEPSAMFSNPHAGPFYSPAGQGPVPQMTPLSGSSVWGTLEETGQDQETSLLTTGRSVSSTPVAIGQSELYGATPKTTAVAPKSSSTKRGKSASAGKTVAKKKRKNGRPLTGYNIFFKQERDNVANLRRTLVHKPGCPSIAKLISIKWKELSPGERARFDTIAAEEKLRQYNEQQGWVNYESEDCKLAVEPEVAQEKQKPFFQHHAIEDVAPWPIESIHAIAKELDDECVDILIRALL